MPFKNLKIKEYLKRPYPYYYASWDKLLLILGAIAILSFSFSYFFEPFEVNRSEHQFNYIWICLIHALLPFVIALVYFRTLDSLQADERKWTLGKEALHLAIVLLLIGIGSFLIRDVIYDKPDNWSIRYFLEEIRNTFLVGLLLLTILLPLNLERLLLKYKSAAGQLSFKVSVNSYDRQSVYIITPIATESFDLDLSSFLFAKVEGNYTEIYSQENNEVKQNLLRLSLKELKKQLTDFPFVFETHRSYLVNIHQIKNAVGNAQGYLISFEKTDIKVPVSRSKITKFNALFANKN